MRGLRGSLALVAVAAGAAACLLAPARAAAADDGAPPVPTLAWHDCGTGVVCSTAAVPLDYDQLGGRTIELALAKLPATDPGRRIGTLFANPGGPGGSGVAWLFRQRSALTQLNQRFDIVGVDPRGVGASRPAIDCLSDHEKDDFFLAQPDATVDDLPALLAAGDRFAAGCRANTDPALLDHVSTADAARDLDLLRQAVGDRQLSYLGMSYGTELGAVYATLFPGRARALALDAAVDWHLASRHPLERWGELQARGNEASLQRFFAFCAADKTSCPFGGEDPAAAYDALLARLDAHPIVGRPGDTIIVNANIARGATWAAMYDQRTWPLLGQGLALAEAGNGLILQLLAENLGQRSPAGHYTNFVDANVVITANDGAWPKPDAQYRLLLQRLLAETPHFAGPFVAFAPTRRDLPVGEDAYRGPVSNPGWAPTALVIGGTDDGETPYEESLAMTRQLGNARLLTREGTGHVSYFKSSCIADYVNAYLIDGALPPQGTVCPLP